MRLQVSVLSARQRAIAVPVAVRTLWQPCEACGGADQSSISRPRCRSIEKTVRDEFELPPVRQTWTVEQKLGGWNSAQAK